MSNSPFQITKTRIQTGFWEGIVTTKDGADHGGPQIEVTIRGEVVLIEAVKMEICVKDAANTIASRMAIEIHARS